MTFRINQTRATHVPDGNALVIVIANGDGQKSASRQDP